MHSLLAVIINYIIIMKTGGYVKTHRRGSKEFVSNALRDTQEVAQSVVRCARPHRDRAFVLALNGELGAGKTQVAKAISRAFGVERVIQSPTFVIMKSYPLSHPLFSVLYHFDWYRITSKAEIDGLGWGAITQNPKAFVVVEWAENCELALPSTTLYMNIEVVSTTQRRITLF